MRFTQFKQIFPLNNMGKTKRKEIQLIDPVPVGNRSTDSTTRTVVPEVKKTSVQEEYERLIQDFPPLGGSKGIVGRPPPPIPVSVDQGRINDTRGVTSEGQGSKERHQAGTYAVQQFDVNLLNTNAPEPQLPHQMNQPPPGNETLMAHQLIQPAPMFYFGGPPGMVSDYMAPSHPVLAEPIVQRDPKPATAHLSKVQQESEPLVAEFLLLLKYECEPFPAYGDVLRFLCSDFSARDIVTFLKEHQESLTKIAMHRYYHRLHKVPELLESLFKSRRLLLTKYVFSHITITDVDRIQLSTLQATSLVQRIRLTPKVGRPGRFILEATLHITSLPPNSVLLERKIHLYNITKDLDNNSGHFKTRAILENLYSSLNRSSVKKPYQKKGGQ